MNKKYVDYLICFGGAYMGGWIFILLNLPLPWLLGPTAFAAIISNLVKTEIYCPRITRNVGLIVIGYSMGSSFTVSILSLIAEQLPWMLLMTLVTLLFCFGLAYLNSKLAGFDYLTILAGSTPGAITQMMILAEETDGLNLTVVTFFQVTRLLMIVLLIPLVVFSPLFDSGKEMLMSNAAAEVYWQWHNLYPNAIFYLLAIIFCLVVGKKIKLPTVYLLGPLIGTALLSVSGLENYALHPVILNIAQFFIGSYLGLMLKPKKMENRSRIIICSLLNGFMLISFTWALSLILVKLHGIPPVTSYLSLAPGGMDQMGIIANEAGAILSLVSSYQLFRSLFITFVMPPVLQMLVRYRFRTKLMKSSK